jgi:hypothetical protein
MATDTLAPEAVFIPPEDVETDNRKWGICSACGHERPISPGSLSILADHNEFSVGYQAWCPGSGRAAR